MVLSSFISFYPPYFFCKVNANERNGKEILSFYLLRYMISIIFIYIFHPCSKSFLRLRSIPIKSPQPPSPIFHISKMRQRAGYTPLVASFFIYQIRDKNHPLYISSEIKIILYISLPRIKIILYIFIPRAKNCHHPIYFLGTKVSQVWSS